MFICINTCVYVCIHAYRYYTTVLSLDPTDTNMMCAYGESLARLGPARQAEAEECFLKALALRPLSANVLNR